MEKKKILIVGRTFYPEKSPRSFRTTELAQELARLGHEVTVVLPKNIEHQIKETFDNKYQIKFDFYGPLTWPVFGRSKWIGDWKRKLGRLLFLLFEYPNIEIYYKLPQFLKNYKGYDLVISIAVPHENHWAIAKLRKKGHQIAKTWIADCGDPFMTNVLETISPPFYFTYLENNFLKRADYLSLPTAGSFDAYNQKYRNKFRIIPQGFSFEGVKLYEGKIEHKVPTFAYAGGVSPTGVRSLHALVKLLLSLNKSFEFHIYSSNAKSTLAELVKGFEDRFILHDAIERSTLLFEFSKMDFLVNLDNGTTLNTPSKLIDYALTKRPILNVNPLAPEFDLVNSFLEGNYDKKFIVVDIQKYNIQNVANSFLECIQPQE